jgi:hypothetical protein
MFLRTSEIPGLGYAHPRTCSSIELLENYWKFKTKKGFINFMALVLELNLQFSLTERGIVKNYIRLNQSK